MAIGNGSRSNSRSGRGSRSAVRLSQSKVKAHGADGASSSAGGHPLNGPDSPQSPTKRDVKHRFEITKKLGSGTYGKVSLAYDHKTEREVAVKLIKKSAIENKQDLVRIRREIRIMSALTHPNIIQIYEVFENKDKIIIVMEYASGGELYDYVSTYGSLPEPEARRIFRQITSAVLYCHKHRVAHRDLKLENILLDVNSAAKIADFGLSNYFSDKSLLSTFCGSPLYASPEIINGTPYRGPEVDCWSLGILLYTLVYGSMPFDGRDFNRMVRQIKRGAYFEPDTPSTASMLIRNMLRVNPDRRSDIDEIASHWWLNLEENMPVIQELPENQILDHTPLTERAETMIVQDLADETDVFMEFGHLSSVTRKKIEEFRRRRKDAEEYIDQSPVQPKSRKTDEQPAMTNREKNLRQVPAEEPTRNETEHPGRGMNDPLERLRALETRLQAHSKDRRDSKGAAEERRDSKGAAVEAPPEHIPREPSPEPFSRTAGQRPLEFTTSRGRARSPTPPTATARKVAEPAPVAMAAAAASVVDTKKPTFVALDSEPSYRANNAAYWRVETDSLNMLMNQVLEQMENGPVSMNLVARIKAHPFYDNRPMVKELLESIIAAQPPSVQEKASKIIQQQSQDLVRRQVSGGAIKRDTFNKSLATEKLPDIVPAGKQNDLTHLKGIEEIPTRPPRSKAAHKAALEERPWHSVEVGFDPDEQVPTPTETAAAAAPLPTTLTPQNAADDTEEETVRDTSFEDQTEEETEELPNEAHVETQTEASRQEVEDEEEEEEEEEELEDEEEYDSDFEELAEEVEEEEDNGSYTSAHSQQESEESGETAPPPDPPASAPAYLSDFDRGLVKRQSKGKYGVSVDLYGRGVSTEEGVPQPRRRIGGTQPLPEQAPYLFDKAKKYILEYPDRIPDSDDEEGTPEAVKSAAERKMNWLRTQDPDVMGSSIENASHSATPTDRRSMLRSPPVHSDTERETDEAIYAAPSTQTNATSNSTSVTLTTPQHTLERDRGGDRVYETVSVVLKPPPLPRKPSSNTQSAPPSVQNTPSPDRDVVVDKHYVTVAELKLAPPSTMPRDKDQTTAALKINTNIDSNHFSDRVSSPPRVFTFNERRSMFSAKSPSPDTARESFPSTVIPENETVSAYIRRKNRERERRQRNRTIGAPEEVLNAVEHFRASEHHHQTPIATNQLDALLSPRGVADTIDVRTDPKRISYRSAIQQSQAPDPESSVRTSLGVIPTGESRDSSFSGHSGHYVADAPLSPSSQSGVGTKVDPFYSYHSRLRDAPASASLFNYVRPRYHDDSYRKSSIGDAAAAVAAGNSPAKFNQTANSGLRLTSEERAKSRSMHELTPDRPTDTDRPSSSSNETRRYGQTPSYTTGARRHHTMVGYEDEVPSTLTLATWATEPKRYEVYQTRAERQAERNTSSTNYPSYRPSGTAAWYESQMRSGTSTDRPAYTPGAYRSRFDDNFLYRRSAYDVERDNAASDLTTTTHSRFRPPRRVTVALGEDAADITRNAYNRSQSVDRRITPRGPSEERPSSDALRPTNYYSSGLTRNRLLTPEVTPSATDYAYVSYHDSSGVARGSQPREPPDVSRQPARGILKNKQSADVEPRALVSGNGRGMVGGSGTTAGSGVKFKPVTDMFDRLKRHLSAEKSVSPAPRSTSSRFSSGGSGAYGSYESDRDDSPRAASKKRSILSLARRRTSEIRLGHDGKVTTNGYTDVDDTKRPSSPLEKIKGLFRRSKDNLTADHSPLTQHHVASASVSPHRNYSDKVSSYTSPSTASYTPQYRKYDRSYVSRYSYTPSSTTSATPTSSAGTRHWYEDNSHMY